MGARQGILNDVPELIKVDSLRYAAPRIDYQPDATDLIGDESIRDPVFDHVLGLVARSEYKLRLQNARAIVPADPPQLVLVQETLDLRPIDLLPYAPILPSIKYVIAVPFGSVTPRRFANAS